MARSSENDLAGRKSSVGACSKRRLSGCLPSLCANLVGAGKRFSDCLTICDCFERCAGLALSLALNGARLWTDGWRCFGVDAFGLLDVVLRSPAGARFCAGGGTAAFLERALSSTPFRGRGDDVPGAFVGPTDVDAVWPESAFRGSSFAVAGSTAVSVSAEMTYRRCSPSAPVNLTSVLSSLDVDGKDRYAGLPAAGDVAAAGVVVLVSVVENFDVAEDTLTG